MGKLSNQDFLQDFLLQGQNTDANADAEYPLPPLDAVLAVKLVERIEKAPLFAHAYAFHLNFNLGDFTPWDLLDFAAKQNLAGISIHVDCGNEHSLEGMDDESLLRFGKRARELELRIHMETSSTMRLDLAQVIRVALRVGAESVRCYPRHEGKVSEILAWTIDDLKQLGSLDPEGSLYYFLEQHEDLKSSELVKIITAVNNPRLSLLFDFGNMVNAGEEPDDALTIMAPYVGEVHVKDLRIVADRGGQAQLGCKSGEGDINMPLMMFRLLLLGDNESQVQAFGMEEEVGYSSPAFRFSDEGNDPLIPFRKASETALSDDEPLEARLAREREDAIEQIVFIKNMLRQMHVLATAIISNKSLKLMDSHPT